MVGSRPVPDVADYDVRNVVFAITRFGECNYVSSVNDIAVDVTVNVHNGSCTYSRSLSQRATALEVC